MKPKPIDPTEISEAALRPLIEWAAQDKNRKAEITAKLSEIIGEPILRQAVEAWLRAKPGTGSMRRVEPRLGIGLVLLLAGQQLMAGGGSIMLDDIIDSARTPKKKARKA